jgi:hypothetical protein
LIGSVHEGAGIAQSVWRWATGWTNKELKCDFRRGQEIVLFTATKWALGPTHLPSNEYRGLKLPTPPPPASLELYLQPPIRLMV